MANSAFTKSSIATPVSVANGGVNTCLTYETKPVGSGTLALANLTSNSNTTQALGMVYIPFKITVNKISIEVQTVSVAGTLDLTVYSEDGQSKLIDVTTATISATGIVTTSVSSVTLNQGNYYFAVNSNSTADLTCRCVSISATALRNPSSEPLTAGTQTITAGTPPTTFTPSSLTVAASVPLFRLDN